MQVKMIDMPTQGQSSRKRPRRGAWGTCERVVGVGYGGGKEILRERCNLGHWWERSEGRGCRGSAGWGLLGLECRRVREGMERGRCTKRGKRTGEGVSGGLSQRRRVGRGVRTRMVSLRATDRACSQPAAEASGSNYSSARAQRRASEIGDRVRLAGEVMEGEREGSCMVCGSA